MLWGECALWIHFKLAKLGWLIMWHIILDDPEGKISWVMWKAMILQLLEIWGALKLVEQFEFKGRSSILHWLVLVVHKLLNCFYTGPLFSWWFTWRFMHGCCHICLLFQMTIGPRIHFYMHLYGFWSYSLHVFPWTVFFFLGETLSKGDTIFCKRNICHNFPFFFKNTCLKVTENYIFGWSYFCRLATILKIPQSNVVSSVEVCLGMLPLWFHQ